MGQLSIYDKLRHHSDKDFTCSIGKGDVIYLTFRHKTWERFTSSDYLSVYVGKSGALKFGDPKDLKMLAPCFKLTQNTVGDVQTRESTRYIKITGRKYPAILEQVRRTAGSYDFPPQDLPEEERKALTAKIAKELNATLITDEKDAEDIKAQLKANLKKMKANEEKLNLKDLKAEDIAQQINKSIDLGQRQLRAYTQEEEERDVFRVRRNQFFEDLRMLTESAQSPEERVAVINALAALYGRNKPVPHDPTDPWDIP